MRTVRSGKWVIYITVCPSATDLAGPRILRALTPAGRSGLLPSFYAAACLSFPSPGWRALAPLSWNFALPASCGNLTFAVRCIRLFPRCPRGLPHQRRPADLPFGRSPGGFRTHPANLSPAQYDLTPDSALFSMVDRAGFEPATHGLRVRRSTVELTVHVGSPDGIRTRVPTLKGWCPSPPRRRGRV